MRRTIGRFGYWKPLVWGCMLLVGGFVMVRFAPAQPPDVAKFGVLFAQAYVGPSIVQLYEQTDSSAGGGTFVILVLTTCDDQGCFYGGVELAADQYTISQRGASVTGPIIVTLQSFSFFCDEPPP